jgi:xanthine dehydrogenase accessory factor
VTTESGAVYPALAAAIRARTPAVLLTLLETPPDSPGPLEAGAKLLLVDGEPPLGSLGDPELDRVAARDAAGELAAGRTRTRRYGPRGEAGQDDVGIFVESFVPPPRMLIFGAVDFAGALAQVAKILGYRVTVVDARATFATKARFPTADEVVVDWPHRLLAREGPGLTPRDAVCVLTHDAKFDVPAIVAALETPVGFLGAMGSRRTHGDRVRRLREAGVDDAGLARLHAPIGLDLGAVTPEETAVSICAEIIAARSGRDAAFPLRSGRGPIHTLEAAG